MTRILFTTLLLLIAGDLLGLASASNAAQSEKAVLTIVEKDSPGQMFTTAELHHGGALVQAEMSYYSNPPTNEEGFHGNLHAIYSALARRPHPNPDSLNGREALLKALARLPLRVTQQKVETLEEGMVRRFSYGIVIHSRTCSPAFGQRCLRTSCFKRCRRYVRPTCLRRRWCCAGR